tara:strand:+ start:57 stop:344 length:288 start_codon:yes stop_codon:yes gene_type:complete
MASLKGICTATCTGDKRSCWHKECKIVRRFTSGKFLIENIHGYVRAVESIDLLLSISEESKYGKCDLKVDNITLGAEAEREQIRQRMASNLFTVK